MMDLSDGLRQDLTRLCTASGVGALINPDQLPAHPDARGASDTLSLMTAFGEEYELLFTAPLTRGADSGSGCSIRSTTGLQVGWMPTRTAARDSTGARGQPTLHPLR